MRAVVPRCKSSISKYMRRRTLRIITLGPQRMSIHSRPQSPLSPLHVVTLDKQDRAVDLARKYSLHLVLQCKCTASIPHHAHEVMLCIFALTPTVSLHFRQSPSFTPEIVRAGLVMRSCQSCRKASAARRKYCRCTWTVTVMHMPPEAAVPHQSTPPLAPTVSFALNEVSSH